VSVIKLRDDVMWREVDGEIVVLDKRTWQYIGINQTGATLWTTVVGGASRDQLVDRLLDEFEVDRETAEQDVASFLETLRELQLLADA
jgi:coenzyme PQQ synthesis protein D (PqqD)